MQFNKIVAGSPAFEKATATFESLVDRFDYDGMANAFAELKPGEILSFEYKKGKGAVVTQQFEKRGLTRGVDFSVRSAGNEGADTATVMVKRESDKTVGPATHGKRGRKSAAVAPSAPTDAGSGAGVAKPLHKR